MRYKASTLRIIDTLKELYPEGLCSLQYEKDYELLFAVRLSAQCTDARVNMGFSFHYIFLIKYFLKI